MTEGIVCGMLSIITDSMLTMRRLYIEIHENVQEN